MAKWGKVPLLDTYRQMAIRQQKKKDWEACKWWAERGLALYGKRAAREEAVEDLIKRRNRAIAKLEAAISQQTALTPEEFARADVGGQCGDSSPAGLKVDLRQITHFVRLAARADRRVGRGKVAKPFVVRDRCHPGLSIGMATNY